MSDADRIKGKLRARISTPPYGAHLSQDETAYVLGLIEASERLIDAAQAVIDRLNPNVPWSAEALELVDALAAFPAPSSSPEGPPDA